MKKRILVTGGAGFIGSHFVSKLLHEHGDAYDICVVDCMTYAGDIQRLWLQGVHTQIDFVHLNICAYQKLVNEINPPDYIVHFAAESHVDRSIHNSTAFVESNVLGTQSILDFARVSQTERVVLVSTDEVYGERLTGESYEEDPPKPRNPYSASKLGGEALGMAYYNTYQTPVLITRGCNTFGKFQHPEKFIPKVITCALADEPIPVYGNGLQEREWIEAGAHADAVYHILMHGKLGETYNIGSGVRHTNIEMVKSILGILRKPESLISYVADRPGHDRRYAMNSGKLDMLGWNDLNYICKSGGPLIQDVIRWYISDEGQKWSGRLAARMPR